MFFFLFVGPGFFFLGFGGVFCWCGLWCFCVLVLFCLWCVCWLFCWLFCCVGLGCFVGCGVLVVGFCFCGVFFVWGVCGVGGVLV
ncbi:hypothetical protein [Pseudomonas syringae group genomosp. 7]|uniref:hypothetical protein n=1 Tax=Pseudomonas syringae group genomosp. 7 TaxID=251699 RepID=UPI003770765F